MTAPPAVAREESPDEVLAGSDGELVEVVTGDVDGDDTGSLADDVRDAYAL